MQYEAGTAVQCSYACEVSLTLLVRGALVGPKPIDVLIELAIVGSRVKLHRLVLELF